MKHIVSIPTILLLISLFFSACTSEAPSSQIQENSDDNNQVSTPIDSNEVSTPVFFNDIGKTLSILENEHPKAEYFYSNDCFPDAAGSCFGEPETPYAYLFFGGQSGDFEVVMDECKDQLQCAGFVTTAGVLFPEMEDDMSFSDFFSLIGVSDYFYFDEEDFSVAEGWLNFKYNDMDVWLNTNEILSGGGWEFTDARRVRSSAPGSIADEELSHQNQELADSIMFTKIWPAKDWVYEAEESFSETYYPDEEEWDYDWPLYDIDISLPFININSADAQTVNNIMLAHLNDVKSSRANSLGQGEDNRWAGWSFTYYISYESSLNNNLLSLKVRIETSGSDVPYVYYETYNFDIPSRKLLTQDELLTAFDLTTEALDTAVQQAIRTEVENFDNEKSGTAEYINKDIDDTIEQYKSIKEKQALQFYVDKTGKLFLYLDVSDQIGRCYHSALLPLNF